MARSLWDEKGLVLGLMLPSTVVLILGGWAFWIAGTGQYLLLAAVATSAVAIAARPTWTTLAMVLVAWVIGCLPLLAVLIAVS